MWCYFLLLCFWHCLILTWGEHWGFLLSISCVPTLTLATCKLLQQKWSIMFCLNQQLCLQFTWLWAFTSYNYNSNYRGCSFSVNIQRNRQWGKLKEKRSNAILKERENEGLKRSTCEKISSFISCVPPSIFSALLLSMKRETELSFKSVDGITTLGSWQWSDSLFELWFL
jgi:hypothetical protein